jgi:hypothetical protein
MALDAREERRRNVKALAIAGGILIIFALFAYRPATVIGVDGGALAVSIGSSVLADPSNCIDLGAGRWRCHLNYRSDAATATVEMRAFGCWTLVDKRPERADEVRDSGCITALDLVFAP